MNKWFWQRKYCWQVFIFLYLNSTWEASQKVNFRRCLCRMISGMQTRLCQKKNPQTFQRENWNKADSVDTSNWDYLRGRRHRSNIKHHLYRRRADDRGGKHERGSRYRHRGAPKADYRPATRGEAGAQREPTGDSLKPLYMKCRSCAVKSSLSFLRHGRQRGMGSAEIKAEGGGMKETAAVYEWRCERGDKSETKQGSTEEKKWRDDLNVKPILVFEGFFLYQ